MSVVGKRVSAWTLLLLMTVLASACGVGGAPAPGDDEGLVVAESVGALLAVVSIMPGDVGGNQVRLRLFDPAGKPAASAGRIVLRADGDTVATTGLARDLAPPGADPGPAHGSLFVPRAGLYEVSLDLDGAGSATIPLELPAPHAAPERLAAVDRAMNALRGYREQQTLTSGGPVYTFLYEYSAPDRMRFSFSAPAVPRHETVIVGDRRWDRDTEGHDEIWRAGSGGTPIVVPSFSYGDRPAAVRVIGHEEAPDGSLDLIAFVGRSGTTPLYYRLWVDPRSDRVRGYVMMAVGHYMRGTYTDLDASIEIEPP